MKQSLQIWLEAARPKTLPLALVSILTGSVLAYSAGHFSLTIAIMAFATATLLQILSNLANDYGDAVKGTDNENRLGPQRAMQTGAVSAKQMKQAIIFNIVLTAISGLVLVFYALSSPESIITFIGLGILAIIAAIAYTMGSKPYGYVGLGDISVFLFFGLLGVSGTYFLHTGHVDTTLFLPALGCGLLAVAVLNINNMRDIENDRECGKRTVAVRLGQHKAKQYHFILLGGAILAFAAYLLIQDKPLWISLPFLLSVYVVIHHGKAVWDTEKPAQIAPMLPVIVKCSLVTNVLFATIVVVQTLVS
ncbi:1,4-dihydroxy-2-naphthoate polyprenyltransferase [Vibrio parahaemolyticus]|uniref:1,4-dihydroxy-2-naphthoate polyprenyltransferase n=1 Tax=Vibrio parahaemolyticus TaxID=670 RepID=UPI00186A9A12|nr:1,4-dihydroxy-2-naphthoate polyprenyltransferase [Vibrio parahaemolyticus]ELB2092752.1 1,4-dihydroxy-2-naphthoate polyprenyltransferase [Vibrio parahaemolyticus]ELB2125235.1 1,4-dihydroxy-2-naphthoate polyprenyltransferase [Vibrio parahaemolyticus]MBE4307848.1 1,4-dihydroxy-2-naphthoate polyprenyltransferase [Vibrio parahaemolyticus]MDF5664737.1 1,4-dihydroxy-2-naphthoate polyprenyltransferase [Vibrio parahaemolyticus]MEA5182388.1 1,4-dihydroxy-2-naphthoate polyprenyltransferase [Vibrio par